MSAIELAQAWIGYSGPHLTLTSTITEPVAHSKNYVYFCALVKSWTSAFPVETSIKLQMQETRRTPHLHGSDTTINLIEKYLNYLNWGCIPRR